jgi:hypothetical protein
MATKMRSVRRSLVGQEENIMLRRNALLYGTAILACGVSTAGAQADPLTIQLFFTAFSPTPNPILTTNATLNGSSLTFSGASTIAHANGADRIRFLPDSNLAIGGQGDGAATGHIFEITNTGTSVATVTAPSNGTNFDGSHHLASNSQRRPCTRSATANAEQISHKPPWWAGDCRTPPPAPTSLLSVVPG